MLCAMDRALNFLFKTNSGRLLLVALVAALAAYAARVVLVDIPAQEAKNASGVGADNLEAMGEALSEALDERADVAAELPARTQWYPVDVPCGAEAPYAGPRDAVWDLLRLPKTGKTQFQYRFEFAAGEVKMRARRDSDCDGFYAVWLLEGDANSTLGQDITAQNILE